MRNVKKLSIIMVIILLISILSVNPVFEMGQPDVTTYAMDLLLDSPTPENSSENTPNGIHTQTPEAIPTDVPIPTDTTPIPTDISALTPSLSPEQSLTPTPTSIPAATLTTASSIEAAQLLDSGSSTTVTGVVTKVVDATTAFIQDDRAGIALYNPDGIGVLPGSVISVTGTVQIDDGFVRVLPTGAVETYSTGQVLPSPKGATIAELNNLKYKGMLVKVSGVRVVSKDAQNITLKDENDGSRIQVNQYLTLNEGIDINSKVDITAVASIRAGIVVLRTDSSGDIALSAVPEPITTEEQLDAIRNNLYGNYVLMNNIVLTTDWAPIGDGNKKFQGTLDGGGFSITGLNIVCNQEFAYGYAGLFGNIGPMGTVKNLNVSVKPGGAVIAINQDGTYAGIIAAVNEGTIDSCSAAGTVKGRNCVGGLTGNSTGKILGSRADCTVNGSGSNVGGVTGSAAALLDDCHSTSTVTASGSYTGGLVGQTTSDLTNCDFNGSVSGSSNVGGLAGDTSGSVINCRTAGAVNGGNYVGGLAGSTGSKEFTDCISSANVSGGDNTGGLIGSSSAAVSNCHTSGKVNGGNSTGGLIGYQSGSAITNCYAEGRISGNDNTGGLVGCGNNGLNLSANTLSNIVSGHSNVGGLIGNMAGTMTDCCAKGSVTGSGSNIGGLIGLLNSGFITLCHAEGCVAGNLTDSQSTGGLVGAAATSADWREDNITISKCYAQGNVTGFQFTGGLIGNVYATAYYGSSHINVNDCYASGNVAGRHEIGGLTGESAFRNEYDVSCSITNCLATGRVSGAFNTGGITGQSGIWNGWSAATITKCYYDMDTTCQSNTENGIGKPTWLMRKPSTFLTWDFASVWTTDTDINNGYPYLKDNVPAVPAPPVIEISNEDQLVKIRENMLGHYELTRDITLTRNWIPIGDDANRFYGSIDGNGFKISGLSVVQSEEYTYPYAGLIGVIATGGTVKNLKIETLTGGLVATTGNSTTGILAAVNYGTVSGCTVKGRISGTDNIGGLVGQNYGKITDSVSIADVTGNNSVGGFVGYNAAVVLNCSSSGNVTGNNNVGGFSGYNESVANNCSSVSTVTGNDGIGSFSGYAADGTVFTNCYATGNAAGNSNVGGLAGVTRGTVTGCYAKGSVTGNGSNIGGLIGSMSGTLTDCYAKGNVKGNSYVGGLAGNMSGTLTDCCAKGNVTGNGSNIGGLIGAFNSGSITLCHAEGCVAGNLTDSQNTGGLVGAAATSADWRTDNISIFKCYATGNVTGFQFTGGLIGNVYATAYYGSSHIYVNDCYASGNVAGRHEIGGLTGESAFRNEYDVSCSITNCLATGRVSGVYNTEGITGQNGIWNGWSPATITKCYYDMDTTGQNNMENGIGKTDSECKDPATFLTWDFASVWGVDTNINHGYPYLRDIPPSPPEPTYIIISNEDQLFNIRYNLTANYRLANDIELHNIWYPIGDAQKPFEGIFDGQGYSIKNMNVPQDEEYEFSYAGLFGYTGPSSIIENLNVITDPKGGVATTGSGKYAGGIAANNYGWIKNCTFTGKVRAQSTVGGIVGNNCGHMDGCSANITVTGSEAAGGLAGYNAGSIENCRTSGTVEGSTTGGITGHNDCDITNCTADTLTVTGTGSTGGISGYSTGKIDKSYSSGDIRGNDNVGGLVGCTSGGLIINSNSDAAVTGNSNIGGLVGLQNSNSSIARSHFSGQVTGNYDNIGGLVGYNKYEGNTVNGCRNSGTVKGRNYVGGLVGNNNEYGGNSISDSYYAGKVFGSSYVGGLVGLNNYTGWSRSNDIIYCHSSGTVYADGSYVGGLIGYNNCTVTKCYSSAAVSGNPNGSDDCGGLFGYNTGTTTLCYSTGTVMGRNSVGGLIGFNTGNITNCYALGNVTGKDTVGGMIGRVESGSVYYTYASGFVKGWSNTGGLIGTTAGKIANSYYNQNTSGQNDTGKGIPKSATLLKQQLSYVSWDFDTVWRIDPGINASAPYLRDNIPPDQSTVETMISTEQDFINIRNNLDGNYKLANDIILTTNFEPIGDSDHPFTGSLDGNGYKVSGLSIQAGDKYTYAGLFGVLGAGSKVSNLKIVIKSGESVSSAAATYCTGGLAGKNLGAINNCSVSGTVSGVNNVGGLVGKNQGTVSGCSTEGKVLGSSDSIGGLVGINEMFISNSFSGSSVTGTTSIGGLVGSNNGGYILISYATGNVSGSLTNGDRAGGLVGTNSYGTVQKSFSSNAVSGRQAVGGLVGFTEYGDISGSCSVSTVTGQDYTGGLAAYVAPSNSISRCYAQGNVNGGGSYAGGLIGYMEWNSGVTNCYASGKTAGNAYTGGLIGGYWGEPVTNCYYDMNISEQADTGKGDPKSTDEMQTKSTYAGWDFDTVWILDNSVSPYPYLKWQTGPSVPPSIIPAVSVTINAPSLDLNVGEALVLTTTLFPGTSTDSVTWATSDAGIAAVNSSGIVVGIKTGTAEIIATAGSVSSFVTVTVNSEQKAGKIVAVKSIRDIHLPDGSTLDDAAAQLPKVVDVVLDSGAVASVSINWTLVPATSYNFTGVPDLSASTAIINPDNIQAGAKIIVDPPVQPAKNITGVAAIEASISNGTSLSNVLAMLPSSVSVNLEDGNTVSLQTAWSQDSTPAYDALTAGVYTFKGTFILPADNSVKNTGNIGASAVITVMAPVPTVKAITGLVAIPERKVANGTTLDSVKALLPGTVYAVLDNLQTVELPVAWSHVSSPEYTALFAGTYTFTGTITLPSDGYTTNPLKFRPTVNITVDNPVGALKNIVLSKCIAQIGGQADVTVNIDPDSGMAAGSFIIDYDSSQITPVSYTTGSAVQNANVMVNLNYIDPVAKKSRVKVSWMGTSPMNNGGVIVKVSFMVNAAVADNTDIPVTVTGLLLDDPNSGAIPCNIIPGEIHAVTVILGDVNGDGTADISDALLILRYDVGLITLTDKQKLAADVNKDGAVDFSDAVKIQRVDIGLDIF